MKRAFTLIELLVALAIIGMLIAILLPVVHAARAAAQNVSCQARLRQLCTADYVFALSDRRGRFHWADYSYSQSVRSGDPADFLQLQDTDWTGAITGQSKLALPADQADIWNCPANTDFNTQSSWTDGAGKSRTSALSYVYHGNRNEIYKKYANLNGASVFGDLKIVDLSLLNPYAFEQAFPNDLNTPSPSTSILWKDRAGLGKNKRRYFNHLASFTKPANCNIGYVDGHVASRDADLLIDRIGLDNSLYRW
ncbi:MAG: type II secretion system protein [Planctomycetota bacterium]